MRRLAEDLQVDPMSIYKHVAGKEALLDGLTELLWSKVRLADPGSDWKKTLLAFATSLRELGAAHPNAYGLLLGRGLLPGPALSAIETSLRSLEAAGLDREQGAEMVRTLLAYAAGYAMLELSSPMPAGDSELEQLVTLTRSLPRDAPPNLVEVARLMATCDMDHQFDLGLELILAGLEARLPRL